MVDLINSDQILPFNYLDDTDFNLVLYELRNGPVRFDSNRFESLNYNPIFSNVSNDLTRSNNLDPDKYFNVDSFPCEYFIESQFNEMLQKETQSDFSIFHLNIRSLQRNFSDFTNFLANLDIKFSVIGISETWLSDSDHSVDIDGYNFIHKNRLNRPGGGIGLYISDNLEYKLRTDLCFDNLQAAAESLFIEITRPKGKNIIVGVIYRPPNQPLNEFLAKNNESLGKISRENKICYYMGDFNLNLINFQTHNQTGEFLDDMYSNMFLPLITRPSRITSHSATLIDNIFCNSFDGDSRNGLLFTDISDHFPIFSVLFSDSSSPHTSSNERITVRDKNPKNLSMFTEQLQAIDWSFLINNNNPNDSYNSFLEVYSDTYNACFPLKIIKKKHHRFQKPWLSKGLLKSIRTKNKLYKRYLQAPNIANETSYKNFKNKLNHSLRIAKKSYYEKKLNEVKSNTRATWRLLNEILNKKKSKTKASSIFKVDNREISDPLQIVNRFCEYFSNIGPTLAKGISTSSSHRSFLQGTFSDSISFFPVTQHEIKTIASSFLPGKASGHDCIPMSIIKNTIDSILEPLTHIINLSLAHGIVPDKMKVARVIPVFKSGDVSAFTNYRPISVLPCFSKFLERAVHNRLIDYLNKYNILSNNQYGFRKNHSTSLALIDFYDKVSSAFDRGEFAVGVFLDLSKASDTVNFDILFDKLQHYGIRGLPLEWTKSYFSDRFHFVDFNGHSSQPKRISCGVPQGSILGPLFFILYINDIINASTILKLILFADDTSIFFSHKDIDYLSTILNSELAKISDWLKANKLSLNLKKTKCIVFVPRQKRQNIRIQLAINNQQIDQVNETVFLGVTLDDKLTWKPHISHIANKISKSIGIIYRSSFYLPKTSLLTLYYSLIFPYLYYCNMIWALTYETNLRRLVILQKRVVRIVSRSKFDAHTDPLFKALGLMKFLDIRFVQLGLFMYSYANSLLPNQFKDVFPLNKQIHSYNTRLASAYRLPFCRTNTRQFSVFYQGPKFYNSLDIDIRNCKTISSFKKNLKLFFLKKY